MGSPEILSGQSSIDHMVYGLSPAQRAIKSSVIRCLICPFSPAGTLCKLARLDGELHYTIALTRYGHTMYIPEAGITRRSPYASQTYAQLLPTSINGTYPAAPSPLSSLLAYNVECIVTLAHTAEACIVKRLVMPNLHNMKAWRHERISNEPSHLCPIEMPTDGREMHHIFYSYSVRDTIHKIFSRRANLAAYRQIAATATELTFVLDAQNSVRTTPQM